MKNFINRLVVSALVVAASLAQAQTLNPNFTVNATVEIGGGNTTIGDAVSLSAIQGSTLTRTCLLLVRQKAEYIAPNGTKGSITFGDYEGSGSTTAVNFQQFGIPDGSAIDLILDVSASNDINLDVWFTVSYTSPCVAAFTCSGNAFRYTYAFVGLKCGATVAKFGQCGGAGYTGPTTCAAGSTCSILNPFFSQCL